MHVMTADHRGQKSNMTALTIKAENNITALSDAE